jgi:hypothetical protein
MCEPNLEYQYININTQVALLSECVAQEQCAFISDMRWNIYQGENDTAAGVVYWNEFSHMNSSQDLHFFGKIYLINKKKF